MSRTVPQATVNTSDLPLAPQAASFDLEWIVRATGRAERRQVVVMTVGFEASPAADPEELAEIRSRRRQFVAGTVARYGGSVGRVDPDLQIVSWGWPSAGEADMRLAVAAAIEVAADQEFAARCGVDAGIGITSDAAGGASSLGFVGEMINTSIELLRTACRGEVLVSESVRGLLADAFDLEAVGEPAEGIVWRARRRKTTACHGRIDRSRAKGLIGREKECTEISEHWQSTARGETRLVRIEGEAGVGKSALVVWLERTVVEAGYSFIAVGCAPENQHIPLEPIRMLIGLLAGLPAPLRRKAVDATGVLDAAPFDGDLVGHELMTACSRLLADRSPSIGALGAALRALLAFKAKARRFSVCIEDLQWADPATIHIVNSLGEMGGNTHGLLIVVTSRAISNADARDRRAAVWQSLQVEKLGTAELQLLVDSGEHAVLLTPALKQQIAQHAGGIPARAHELARLCAETADLEAHWRLLARPNKLNAALTYRLDALATLKPLAQAAAVMGRRVDSRILAAALDMEERVLADRLDVLVGMGIMAHRRRQNATQYRFRDALLWTQAYGSLLKARRRALHLKIAAVLDGELGAEVDPAPQIVAHHWAKGGRPEKAFKWWFKAGLEAAETGSAARAVTFLNHAIAAKLQAPEACTPHEEATLMSVMGAQLRALRGAASNEAVAAYERAMAVVANMRSSPGDIDLDIAWGLTAIHLVRGDIHAASEASSRLVADASERGRDDMLLVALRAHGTARLLAGNVAEAVTTFRDVVSRYDSRRHGDLHRRYVSDPGAVALAHLASALAMAGDRPAWIDARRRALALADDIGHVHTTANVLAVLSLSAMHLGERAAATGLARAVHHIADRQGYAYWRARGSMVLAWDAGMRDPARGLAPIIAALEEYRKTGAGRAMVHAVCLAAEVAIAAGVPGQALDLLAPVKNTGERLGEWLYIPEVKRLEALALMTSDSANAASARALLTEAGDLAREHGSVALQKRIEGSAAELDTAPALVRKRRYNSRE